MAEANEAMAHAKLYEAEKALKGGDGGFLSSIVTTFSGGRMSKACDLFVQVGYIGRGCEA